MTDKPHSCRLCSTRTTEGVTLRQRATRRTPGGQQREYTLSYTVCPACIEVIVLARVERDARKGAA